MVGVPPGHVGVQPGHEGCSQDMWGAAREQGVQLGSGGAAKT